MARRLSCRAAIWSSASASFKSGPVWWCSHRARAQVAPETRGSLAGLGPRLAEAGVPAVIAMQDDVSIETIERFTPAFFEELRRDGQIDRAMAITHGVVRARPDWWVPVLFMRLRSGRIGYKPGFGDEREGMRKWPALVNNVKAGPLHASRRPRHHRVAARFAP